MNTSEFRVDKFSFWSSYWKTIENFNEHDKAEIITAYCELAFYGKEADLSNSSELVKTAYYVASENIKNGTMKRLKGKAGGAPIGNQNAAKQKTTEVE